MKMEDQTMVIQDLVHQRFQQYIIQQNLNLGFQRIQGLIVSPQQILQKVFIFYIYLFVCDPYAWLLLRIRLHYRKRGSEKNFIS